MTRPQTGCPDWLSIAAIEVDYSHSLTLTSDSVYFNLDFLPLFKLFFNAVNDWSVAWLSGEIEFAGSDKDAATLSYITLPIITLPIITLPIITLPIITLPIR